MDLVKLGKVVRLHGIAGEMKISTQMDDDFDLKTLKALFDETGKEFLVKRAFRHDGGLIVGLDGVDLSSAKSLINKNFYIARELVAGKILIEDIIGSDVSVCGKTIGTAFDVQDFGSAEVIFIKLDGGGELLVPNVKGLIENFDLKNKTLKFDEQKLREVSDYED